MADMYINYGSFEQWAGTISSKNDLLLEDLHKIQNKINSLAGSYESNAAVSIREAITAMEPKFQQYYEIVQNYSKFLKNTGAEWRATENTNDMNAKAFK